MKLIARFLKPHLWLCVVTVLLLIVDTAGALFIPTLAAEMLNQGTSGAAFDAALRRALAKETRDAAVLIIAQRVSTIQHADQIIVLHEGRMAGIGRHEELLKTCGVYREIYESQTKTAGETGKEEREP